ncbi:MAG: YkgJ family cysteine cluster protein [Archangium sp.]|nr:YkgJ family cysteine cluster protein [Archangium sp.]
MSLCLSCGLCCDGTMFTLVRLDEGEADRLEGRVKLTEDRVHLQQPCVALKSDRCCAVYEDRPKICRAYRCLALSGLESGRMTATEAQELIDEVLERRRALARVLQLDDVHAAVALARKQEGAGSAREDVAEALSRLRRALLILQLTPDDPIIGKRAEPSP